MQPTPMVCSYWPISTIEMEGFLLFVQITSIYPGRTFRSSTSSGSSITGSYIPHHHRSLSNLDTQAFPYVIPTETIAHAHILSGSGAVCLRRPMHRSSTVPPPFPACQRTTLPYRCRVFGRRHRHRRNDGITVVFVYTTTATAHALCSIGLIPVVGAPKDHGHVMHTADCGASPPSERMTPNAVGVLTSFMVVINGIRTMTFPRVSTSAGSLLLRIYFRHFPRPSLRGMIQRSMSVTVSGWWIGRIGDFYKTVDDCIRCVNIYQTTPFVTFAYNDHGFCANPSDHWYFRTLQISLRWW